MQALVMMLLNTKTNTYHPIFYLESWFPGESTSEMNMNYIRFKSKGHHTAGFKTRDEAIKDVHTVLIDKIKSIGYLPNLEIADDMVWDGEGIPADHQIRERKNYETK